MNLSSQGHNLPRWILWGILWISLVGAGLWLRIDSLDTRPLHADEAVQGMIFTNLLETGHYAYNPQHYHGPSLYYLTLPVAWLRGQFSSGSIDAVTLRMVPLLFSLLLAASPFLLRKELGPRGLFVACGFLLLSPGLVYYSGYYIQEMILVAGFAIFAGSWWRYRMSPSSGWALVMGLSAGLMLASKENALFHIVLALLTGGLVVALGIKRKDPPAAAGKPALRHGLIGIAATLLVCLPFYSSFGTHAEGIADAFRGLFAYRLEPGHEKPWFYYLALLAGSDRSMLLLQGESRLLVCAVLGGLFIFLPGSRTAPLLCGRYYALMGLVLLILPSAIPYKTPWLMLGVLFILAIVAGFGAEFVWIRLRTSWWRTGLIFGLLFAWTGLAREANWASRKFPVEPRNPYAYVHTGWDLLQLTNRIKIVAGDPSAPTVKVMADEYWPIPWYLRSLPSVGYWTSLPDDPFAPVMVVAAELAGDLDADRLDQYVVEFRGLRPGKLLLLYIRRDLWERHFSPPGY